MSIDDLKDELRKFSLTRYKLINLLIALASLALYQFIAKPYYRPFIYQNGINDFHIADTLGNTLGTVTTIFFITFLLSRDQKTGTNLIRFGTLILVIYEIGQPLMGKPIDVWDIFATLLTGVTSYAAFMLIFLRYNDSRS